MIYRSSFIRALSLVFSMAVCLSGIAAPAHSALVKPAARCAYQIGVPAANSGLLQSGCAEGDATVKHGPTQHNRVVAFLSKFAGLRPTFPVITVSHDTNLLPISPLRQEQNNLYKEYTRAFLPQKKPEDN